MTILWIRQSLLAFKWNIFKKTKPTQLKIADHKTKEENYLCSNMKKASFSFRQELGFGNASFCKNSFN